MPACASGVKNGGCAGQEYVLEYAEAADPLDEVVEDKGVTILVEPKAVLFLIGTEIDYEVTPPGVQVRVPQSQRDRRLRLRRERHHRARRRGLGAGRRRNPRRQPWPMICRAFSIARKPPICATARPTPNSGSSVSTAASACWWIIATRSKRR